MAETAKLQLFVKTGGGPSELSPRVWGCRLPSLAPGPSPTLLENKPLGGEVPIRQPAAKAQVELEASEDGESVGHCPSCQRLFMLLLLKGVPFTLTTVDTRRSLDVLKDFAPGSQLPILLYDGDAKTDTLQIEEFLEETLGPPEFPSLAPRYRESSTAGNDVFHRFSTFIKNPVPTQDDDWTATCARPWSTSGRRNRSFVSRAAASWTATSSRWLTAACCPSCTLWTRCAHTSAKRPYRPSCAPSAATWTVRCR
ncbi:chloride intracellular channel protein 3 isoform X2 [Zalophus californianus]|uniref:Chloride intracellular channel protein 3 isoform X2 n=1 Tax=Zalophus californianus TaxID=9704 RepID=A0A6J2ESA3_ZALCA|nr:chloride intracellular channel protein 3 isoform X2 [Zalophus californianus]